MCQSINGLFIIVSLRKISVFAYFELIGFVDEDVGESQVFVCDLSLLMEKFQSFQYAFTEEFAVRLGDFAYFC